MSRYAKYMPTLFGGVALQNLVTNGNFANGMTDWTATQAGTPTVSDNVCTFTTTAEQGLILQTPAYVNAHKYYSRASVKLTTGGTYMQIQHKDSAWRVNQFLTADSVEWQTIGGIFTSAADVAVGAGRWAIVDTRKLAWDPVQVKNAIRVDLTALFGAGNEPSLAWCDANIAPFIIY